MSNKKKLVICIGLIAAILLVFLGINYAEISGDKIANNTYINDIEVSKLSKKEAIKKVGEKYKALDIAVSYNDLKWNISPDKLGFSYEIEKSVEEAYKSNRDKGIVVNLINNIKFNFKYKNNVVLDVNLDKEKAKGELENIAKEVNEEVKNATLSVNGSSINIVKDKSAKEVDIKANLKNLTEGVNKANLNLELVVVEKEADIKEEDLKEVDTILGSYTTKFDSNTVGRTANIKIASDRTSDILVMPGEEFSYNEHTGVRSIENGYKNAPVIVQGVVQEGVGGGVCQVSTTLYNATLYAGLEYVKLQNHSIPSSYAEKGRDATVANGGIDFVFKNNLKYPIYVKNYVSGNTITSVIYGSSKDKQNIGIVTNTDKTTEAPMKKVNDSSLEFGKEKVQEKGRNGYTVSTYRIYKDSKGKEIKREKVYTSYYPKKQGVILVGTMQPKTPEAPEEVKDPEKPKDQAEGEQQTPNPDEGQGMDENQTPQQPQEQTEN